MHRRILLQLSIVLILCLAAEGMVSLIPFAFPSSVAAILIFALLLALKLIKEEQIRQTADFLLSNMALVFVPLTVGIIEELDLLKGQVIGFLLVVFLSLILTFLATYGTVRIVQKLLCRRGESHE